MDKPLMLYHRLLRNIRWYLEDVVTGVTGKGKLHFECGEGWPHSRSQHDAGLNVNPATGLPMFTATRDAHGNSWGTANKVH